MPMLQIHTVSSLLFPWPIHRCHRTNALHDSNYKPRLSPCLHVIIFFRTFEASIHLPGDSTFFLMYNNNRPLLSDELYPRSVPLSLDEHKYRDVPGKYSAQSTERALDGSVFDLERVPAEHALIRELQTLIASQAELIELLRNSKAT